MSDSSSIYRDPFHCPCCDVVYSPLSNSDSSPALLNSCSHTMCIDCWKKNRKEKDKTKLEESRTLVIQCALCKVTSNTTKNAIKANYLIDVMLEIETKEKPTHFSGVAIETSELATLKCPGCETQYSSDGDSMPSILYCGHSVCMKCVNLKKRERSEEEKNKGNPHHNYLLGCLKCEVGTVANFKSDLGVPLKDLIKWLNMKKEEHVQSQPRNQFTCADCGLMTPCDRGFLCCDCTTNDGGKQRVLCGFCAHDLHKSHSSQRFLPVKLLDGELHLLLHFFVCFTTKQKVVYVAVSQDLRSIREIFLEVNLECSSEKERAADQSKIDSAESEVIQIVGLDFLAPIFRVDEAESISVRLLQTKLQKCLTRECPRLGINESSSIYRDPFHCPCCDVVYSPLSNSDSSPALLNICSHTMCIDCLKKYRKEKDKTKPEESRTLVIQCALCKVTSNTAENAIKANYLIDVMLEIETKEKPTHFSGVAIEPSELGTLKCPGCKTQYSSNEDSMPYILYCGHSVCMKCVNLKKRERSEEDKNAHSRHLNYLLGCLKCEIETVSNFKCDLGVPLKDLVKWLNMKKEEHVQSQPRNQFTCADCGLMTPCDRGFLCCDCTTTDGGKQRVLCGFCAHDLHKSHSSQRFLPVKLQSMKEISISDVQSKIAKCSLDANAVVDTYKTLMGTVGECFSSAIDTIPLAKKCSDGMTIAIKLKEKTGEYEEILEGIVPAVRKSNQMLEKLIIQLKESFPDLVGGGGESEEKEETADGEREAKRARLEESGKEGEKEKSGGDGEAEG